MRYRTIYNGGFIDGAMKIITVGLPLFIGASSFFAIVVLGKPISATLPATLFASSLGQLYYFGKILHEGRKGRRNAVECMCSFLLLLATFALSWYLLNQDKVNSCTAKVAGYLYLLSLAPLAIEFGYEMVNMYNKSKSDAPTEEPRLDPPPYI